MRKTPLGRTRSNVPPAKEVQHTVVSKSRSVDNVGSTYQPPQQTENLHRKLQRQLTLNPGADPRLVRRYVGAPQQTPGMAQAQLPPQYMAHPGVDKGGCFYVLNVSSFGSKHSPRFSVFAVFFASVSQKLLLFMFYAISNNCPSIKSISSTFKFSAVLSTLSTGIISSIGTFSIYELMRYNK